MRQPSNERFSMLDDRSQTENDRSYSVEMEAYFGRSLGGNMDKLRNFAKFVPRQALTVFLAKHEIFQDVLRVHGHILECGVHLGGGLMTWAQLSAIYEPMNHTRRVVGFDTFEGFPQVHDKDRGDSMDVAREGGLATHAEEDVLEAVRLYDLNRHIGHIPRVALVTGDATRSIPTYVANNPHLVVAMLYLDFDLYEPTRAALEHFLPRMPRGGVLVFDELNEKAWPGETLAVLETVGLSNLRIKRFPFATQVSYAVLE
jgi:Macrocin-O-methyltransferase (TylF)